MRISDWSSDVCSSDLLHVTVARLDADQRQQPGADGAEGVAVDGDAGGGDALDEGEHWLVGTGNGGWSWSWSWSLGSIAFVPSFPRKREQIGRAHVCTPVTNAQLVCRLLLEKKK